MNLNKIMEQAQAMQARVQQAQEEISHMVVEGTSGGGMVTVHMNGKHEVSRVEIDPSLMNPTEADMLSDLVAAAFNDAVKKLGKQSKEKMTALFPAGMPGMGDLGSGWI